MKGSLWSDPVTAAFGMCVSIYFFLFKRGKEGSPHRELGQRECPTGADWYSGVIQILLIGSVRLC